MAGWKQAVSVTPNISCEPGWCLNYTQRAFNVGWTGSTATDGWDRAKFKHTGTDFPSDVAVPVWFAMKDEPAGHVVVRMGDGTIYSTSHPTNKTPYHHPSLKHLMEYYGGRLTLRGWSEDMNGTKVITKGEDMADVQDVRNWGGEIWGVPVDEQTVKNLSTLSDHDVIYYILSAFWWTNRKVAEAANAQKVVDLTAQNAALQKQNEELQKRLDAAENGEYIKVSDVYIRKAK